MAWITAGSPADRVLPSDSVTLVHPQRFNAPPESIADLLRSDRGHWSRDRRRSRHWHLVRGEVLLLMPPGSRAIGMPFGLPSGQDDRPAVVARVDVEQSAPWTRPRLTTVERARDFYLADAFGRALVRIADDQGRLHPDVDLHLGAPFSEHRLADDPSRVTALVRAVHAGDPIYILGRSRLVAQAELAGLRDVPLVPCFAGDFGPVHIYDEPAFRQLAAWYALPWYRKLSLLVRNR